MQNNYFRFKEVPANIFFIHSTIISNPITQKRCNCTHGTHVGSRQKLRGSISKCNRSSHHTSLHTRSCCLPVHKPHSHTTWQNHGKQQTYVPVGLRTNRDTPNRNMTVGQYQELMKKAAWSVLLTDASTDSISPNVADHVSHFHPLGSEPQSPEKYRVLSFQLCGTQEQAYVCHLTEVTSLSTLQ